VDPVHHALANTKVFSAGDASLAYYARDIYQLPGVTEAVNSKNSRAEMIAGPGGSEPFPRSGDGLQDGEALFDEKLPLPGRVNHMSCTSGTSKLRN
jgi:hypothetical protein